MTVGTRLVQLRHQMGIKQEVVAEILGVSKRAVAGWEGDRGYPDIDNLINLTKLYSVSVGYILCGTPDNTPAEPTLK